MSEGDKEGENKWLNAETITQGAVVMIAVWLVGTIGLHCFADGNVTKAGAIGDSFGAVNALFSGVALLGVAVAVILQTTELRDSRIAAQKSATAQEEQTRVLKSQTGVLKGQTRALQSQNSVQEASNKLRALQASLTAAETELGAVWRTINQDREFVNMLEVEIVKLASPSPSQKTAISKMRDLQTQAEEGKIVQEVRKDELVGMQKELLGRIGKLGIAEIDS